MKISVELVVIESVISIDNDGVVPSVVSCFVKALVWGDSDSVLRVFGKDPYDVAVDDMT